mmetsp:Transcript_15102/g.41361  ORF Transcript_15102/g.41361 Transcript_15102/m.41361 type:complete len:239 (+) Transcript_15102:938-1654(+)
MGGAPIGQLARSLRGIHNLRPERVVLGADGSDRHVSRRRSGAELTICDACATRGDASADARRWPRRHTPRRRGRGGTQPLDEPDGGGRRVARRSHCVFAASPGGPCHHASLCARRIHKRGRGHGQEGMCRVLSGLLGIVATPSQAAAEAAEPVGRGTHRRAEAGRCGRRVGRGCGGCGRGCGSCGGRLGRHGRTAERLLAKRAYGCRELLARTRVREPAAVADTRHREDAHAAQLGLP